MSSFTGICCGGGNGDLLEVVRGCSGCGGGFSFSTTTMTEEDSLYPPLPPCFGFAPLTQDDFVLRTFPDLFETTATVLDELEEFYKPFYPILNPLSSPSSSSSSPSPSPPCVKLELERVPEKKVQEIKETSGCDLTGAPAVAVACLRGVKHRRIRKNQQKRMVLQVTAEDMSSDKWAWRKYGQKPIKGSPYPRSYYRCSSSKGCLARKQVERSPSDPEMFVITYTAEHFHTQPTRRNSLAGTPRNKFCAPKTSIADGGDTNSRLSTKDSPAPNSSAAMEDVLSGQGTRKEGTEKEEEQEQHRVGVGVGVGVGEAISEQNELVMCDMILSDDFLLGFDELDRLTSDLADDNGYDFLQQPFPC